MKQTPSARKEPVPEAKAREITDVIDRLKNNYYAHATEGMNRFYELFVPALRDYDVTTTKPLWDKYLAWKNGQSQ